MMNCENASKKIVQSLIDLVNMARWLMDENQQTSVTQELRRLFPSIRGRGRRGESSDPLWVAAGESSASATDTNNTSFATWSTTKQIIEEIWGLKATSKKPLKSMSVVCFAVLWDNSSPSQAKIKVSFPCIPIFNIF